MEVWEPDKEEKLHTLSDRDVKVWEYFVYIIISGIALFLVLELFA